MNAINECCRVVSHADAAPGYRFLRLQAPQIAKSLEPGQFVHLKVPSLEATALRRPFSVFDAQDDIVTVMYKIVGRGTAALSSVAENSTIEMMGPLGFGFPSACAGVPLLVGGGYGVAPLHFLARRFVAAGLKPELFVGGRTKTDLLALDEFAAMNVPIHAATNDGSFGARGFVTEPLDDALISLREAGKRFEFFACGPDGMLHAVAMRATGTDSRGWISMDRHMICGVGACFACIQKVKGPDGKPFNARCCVNGPVFKAEDLIWEA